MANRFNVTEVPGVRISMICSLRVWPIALAALLTSFACSSATAFKEDVIRDDATGKPLAGAMVVYVWLRQPPQAFHAANQGCAGIEVALTDAQGRAKPSSEKGERPPVVHAIYKRGYDAVRIDGGVRYMAPTKVPAKGRLNLLLTNADGTRCSDLILRDALVFLVAVRDEAATLATTPDEARRVEYLTKSIALIETKSVASPGASK